jgi:hypothetical protein
MKNIKILFLFLTFSFVFSAIPNKAHAVSAINSVTAIQTNDSQLVEKKYSFLEKVRTIIKSKIQSVFTLKEKTNSLFWLWATLLILAGMLVGFLLVFLGIAILFSGAAAAANFLGLALVLLGIFVPIVSLSFIFRPLLRNHFEFQGKDVPKKKINLYAFLLSLAPGILFSTLIGLGF